ncbi:MAG: hypothetical protein IIA14_08300 [SAR324 cluster bacterium]|nr:hypothetical protein [SAR324 cluster bacterium]
MLSRFLPFLFAGVIFLAPYAPAEVKTVRKEVRQVFGASPSPEEARIATVARARREALEKAGAYLEGLTIVRNAQVKPDELLALSSGVLETRIVAEEGFVEGAAFGTRVVAEVRVETAGLEGRVATLLRDRRHFSQFQEVEGRTSEILVRVEALEAEISRLPPGATTGEREALKTAFGEQTDKLAAQEWFRKGLALWNGRKFEPAPEALQHFGKAIQLDATFAAGYLMRGNGFRTLERFDEAISDFEKAVELHSRQITQQSKSPGAYIKRARALSALADSEFKRGLKRLVACDQTAPSNTCWVELARAFAESRRQSELALRDLDRAIGLVPDDPDALAFRGRARSRLARTYLQPPLAFMNADNKLPAWAEKFRRPAPEAARVEHKKALADFDGAIRLRQKQGLLLRERALAQFAMRDFQPAIEDLGRAIALEPKNSQYFLDRAAVHVHNRDRKSYFRDMGTACELGHKAACATLGR